MCKSHKVFMNMLLSISPPTQSVVLNDFDIRFNPLTDYDLAKVKTVNTVSESLLIL